MMASAVSPDGSGRAGEVSAGVVSVIVSSVTGGVVSTGTVVVVTGTVVVSVGTVVVSAVVVVIGAVVVTVTVSASVLVSVGTETVSVGSGMVSVGRVSVSETVLSVTSETGWESPQTDKSVIIKLTAATSRIYLTYFKSNSVLSSDLLPPLYQPKFQKETI